MLQYNTKCSDGAAAPVIRYSTRFATRRVYRQSGLKCKPSGLAAPVERMEAETTAPGGERNRRRLPGECSHRPMEPCGPVEDRGSPADGRRGSGCRSRRAPGRGEARGTGGGSAPARPAPESRLRGNLADRLGGTDVAYRHRRRCLHSRSRRFTATDADQDGAGKFQTSGTPQRKLFRLFRRPRPAAGSGNIRVIRALGGGHTAGLVWRDPTETADARR